MHIGDNLINLKGMINKNRIIFITSILIILIMFPALVYATVTFTSSNGNFVITYSNDPSEYDANCTAAEISDLADLLEDVRDLYVNDYNFIAPPTNHNVIIENMSSPNGSGWCTRIRLDPYFLGPRWMNYIDIGWNPGTNIFYTPSTTEMMAVPAHELFHTIQCTSYGGTNPSWQTMRWIIEGQARMLQDKIDLDLDQAEFDGAGYYEESNIYLGSTETSLLDQSYRACLFWNYITEQYGGIDSFCQNEPHVGVDLITEFWDITNTVSRVDGVDTVDDALTGLGHTESFEDVFRDFIVTNYVKDLTGTLPSKYQYVDEDTTPGSYDFDDNASTPAVRLHDDITLGLSDSADSGGIDQLLYDWAAHYFRIIPSNDAVAINIDIDQSTDNSLSYHLLVINGNDLVSEYRIKAKNFDKSVVNFDYDEIIVIVGGLENTASNPARYEYEFTTGTESDLSIEIESPLGTPDAARSRVGSHTDPEEFLSIVNVQFHGVALDGLESTDFTANVGTETASISASGYIMGKYFLLIQAPTQTADGIYDLNIGLSTTGVTNVEDDEIGAIVYNGQAAENVLIIDRSGSMKGPGSPPTYIKINSAITAAKLYIDSFLDSDKVSLVSFNETATTEMDLQDITDATRTTAKNDIDDLEAKGATSIGDGLLKGQDQLSNSGDSGHDWVIILLSDGQENREPDVVDVLPHILGNGTTVHTIAIGPEANATLLRNLAYATPGGTYNFATEPASGDLPNDLANIYRGIAEQVDRQNRILSHRGEGSTWDKIIPVDKNSKEAHFVFSYDSYKPIEFSTELLDPSGNTVPPKHIEYTSTPTGYMGYIIWKVDTPQDGNWRIVGEGSQNTKYLIESAVKNKLKMGIYFPTVEYFREKETYTGEPVLILVSLTETMPIQGADVSAIITNPKTIEIPSELHQIQLFDDGAHSDGAPNDGVYGNYYSRTFQNGTYVVKVEASGISPFTGEDFQREVNGAFFIEKDNDSDGDSLPNSWERLYGLDPRDAELDNGAEGDPDKDGLSNYLELYYGTDPLNPDTDESGELDGSEIDSKKDPLDPSDDTVKPPRMISINAGDNYLGIYYSLSSNYNFVNIYRSTKPETGYKLLDSDKSTGFYQDSNVVNDVAYYYKIAGVDNNDATSTLSRWKMGIPKFDTEIPIGGVLINKGDVSTRTSFVMLNLYGSSDIAEMKITNIPVFNSVDWEPYENKKQWTLQNGEGWRTVYILFKDQAGNIAEEVARDSILVSSEEEPLGKLTLTVVNARGNPVNGAVAQTTSTPAGQTTLSGLSDGNGEITFQNLRPGNYFLKVSASTYQTINVNPTIQIGETTEAVVTLNKQWMYNPLALAAIIVVIIFMLYRLKRK